MNSTLFQSLSWALSLAPPLYAFWAGKRLVARLEDPAFPELRFAQSQRTLLVVIVCLVASLALSVQHGWLKGAVVVLGTLAASFPARRRIFEESWGLAGYLSHVLRFFLAMFGAWLLLALAPTFIAAAGSWGLGVGVGLALITLVWTHFNARIFPLLVGASPLRRPELEAGFRSVMERSRSRAPRLLVAGAPGGHWVNAFALPSVHRPGVLFTEDALELMSPEETAAIFAHEIAHLEHHTRTRMLLRDLVVAVMFAAPLWLLYVYGVGSSMEYTLAWAWPLAVVILLVLASARNQAHEHESDRRAVELVGDPEPVISALTTIHVAMRMPRRWGKNEGRQSHPSLARRIRAIREAARELGLEADLGESGPVVKPERATVLHAVGGDEAVILGEERVHWLSGVEAAAESSPETLLEMARESRSLRYEALRDLRIDVPGMDRRRLVLVDEAGGESKLALRPEDVPAAKRAVERAEGRLGGTVPGRSAESESGSRRGSRIAAAFGLAFGLMPPFSLPFALASGVVLARPARASLSAAGAIGVGAALLGWRGARTGLLGPDEMLLSLGAEALIGALLLYHGFARKRRGLREPERAMRITLLPLGALGLLYVLAGVVTAMSELPLTQLHLAARHSYGLTAVSLGIGAALVTRGGGMARLTALAAFVAAGLLTVAGGGWVRDRLVEDALLRRIESLATERASLREGRELTVPGTVTDLRIAPAGGRVAARISAEDPLPEWREYGFGYILETDAGQRFVPAIDAAFISPDEIAVLEYGFDDRMAVRRLALAPDTATLERWPLPYLQEASLSVDPISRRWEVRAMPHGYNSGRLIWGRLDEDGVQEVEVRVERQASYLRDISVSAEHGALAVTGTVRPPRVALLSAFGLGLGSSFLSEIVAVTDSGEVSLGWTTLDSWCLPPDAEGLFTCVAHDGQAASLLYAVESGSWRLRPLASVPGFFPTGRRLSGGGLVLEGYGAPVWVDPKGRRAVVLEIAADESYFGVAAVGEDVLARAVPNGSETRIQIYRWHR